MQYVGFISISRYRSQIRQPCNIALPGDRTISYRSARLVRALLASTDRTHTGDNNLRDGHLKGPDIWPVGDMVLPHLPTHALFDLYFAHTISPLLKPMSMGASWVGSIAMPFLTPHRVWSTDIGYRHVA